MKEGKVKCKRGQWNVNMFIMLNCIGHTYLASQEFQLHFPEPHLE